MSTEKLTKFTLGAAVVVLTVFIAVLFIKIKAIAISPVILWVLMGFGAVALIFGLITTGIGIYRAKK